MIKNYLHDSDQMSGILHYKNGKNSVSGTEIHSTSLEVDGSNDLYEIGLIFLMRDSSFA